VLKNIYMPAVSGLEIVHSNLEKFQLQFQSIVASFSLKFPSLVTMELPIASSVYLVDLGEFTGENRRTTCDKNKGPIYSL
jgi:hypothetical protein